MSAIFGAQLTRVRCAAGLSLSELARRAEVSPSYVSRLESGGREPSRETVDFLATALNLSNDERNDLRRAAGFLPSDAATLLSLPELAELDHLHRHADEPRRAAIRALVAGLLGVIGGQG